MIVKNETPIGLPGKKPSLNRVECPEEADQILERWRALNQPFPVIPIEAIVIKDRFNRVLRKRNRPIIVDLDGVLISGLAHLEACKTAGIKTVEVVLLAMEALLLGKHLLRDIVIPFLVSERTAIGLRLEQWLQNRKQRLNAQVSINGATNQMDRRLNAIQESDIAKIIGFKSKNDYYCAKQVYLQGILLLMEAADDGRIPIKAAAKAAKLASCRQHAYLESLIMKIHKTSAKEKKHAMV